MRTRLFCIVLIGFLLFLPLLAQNEYIIIVNKSAQNESLNRAALESIFLGKKSRWSDGTKIMPATLKAGEAHELFIQEIVRKSTNAFMNYWRKMIFTGKGVMPISFDDDADLLEYIGRTEGAIGYISSSVSMDGNPNVKAISLED